MLIIPAIDLQDGCVVRFVQGRRDKKIYSSDPLKTAKHWAKQGAKLLHIVDLDGAFDGTPKNLDIVREIAKDAGLPIQFGGGVRTISVIRRLFDYGVERVVLGTRAVRDESFLKKCFAEFKDKIIVSVDTKDDSIATNGWKVSEDAMAAAGFALGLKKIGFKQLIYTDILKDGTLSGPNIKAIKGLLKETGLNIIASGGISSLDDIYKLKKIEKQGVVGVIIGKALYEGRFSLREALEAA
ncbi:MAG: 1-(5-phosphoribosyl)-5-[(5-phosphoribosylamino)methylideneamino]imidazole-4-carboxamide isomerase [Candidatus Omnitrophota bacterium]